MRHNAATDPAGALSTLHKVRLLLPVSGLVMIAAIWFFAGFEESLRLLIVGAFLVVMVVQFAVMSLYIRRLVTRVTA